MNVEELAAIRERASYGPADVRALLAHIDALTARVEAATFQVPRECDCHKGQMRTAQEPEEYRAAVLAILRGEA